MKKSLKHPAFRLMAIAGLSIFLVLVLYGLNNWQTSRINLPNFNRVIVNHAVYQGFTADLRFNSYYFAGDAGGRIYLGNTTSPFHLLEIATDHGTTTSISLDFDLQHDMALRAPQLVIDSPFFFVNDGVLPATYRGRLGDWDYADFLGEGAYFSSAVPIDGNSFGIRTVSSETNENVLGHLDYTGQRVHLSDTILKKQIDGRFCTDGLLLYDKSLAQLIYLYYYRNEYIGLDTSLHIRYHGNTIDSISRAQLQVSHIASDNSYNMAAPPLLVNKYAQAANGRLYVLSGMRAKNETRDQFRRVSVLDVYDLASQTYLFSFYIRNFAGSQMKQFRIFGDRLAVLYDHHIALYRLVFSN